MVYYKCGWDKIYISGDIGLTKASGNLFKKIIDEFSPVSAEKILHIGDKLLIYVSSGQIRRAEQIFI